MVAVRTSRGFRVIAQALLSVQALIVLGPLLAVLLVSVEGEGLGNYQRVLEVPGLLRQFLNSAIVSVSTVVLVVSLTLAAAFAFSKLELRAKSTLYLVVLVGLLVPTISLIVPLFQIMKAVGLFNNYLAVILPLTAVFLPFTLLLTRNFINELPDELLDAARIDGCNTLQTLILVIAPLARPILIVVVVWVFLNAWNEYFLGLVFMRDTDMKLITQAPAHFYGITGRGDQTPKVFATLVMISLPVILVYLRLSHHLRDGILTGSVNK